MTEKIDLSALSDVDLWETLVKLEDQYLSFLTQLEDDEIQAPNNAYTLQDMERTLTIYLDEAQSRGMDTRAILGGDYNAPQNRSI